VLEGPYGFYAPQLGGVPSDAEAHLATLGQRYHIRTAAMKPHPCTAINLVPLALLRALLREHRIDPNEVRAVRVRRSRTTGQVPNVHSYGPFGHQYVATSSLPFAVAALLTDGEVHPHRFLEPDDPALLSMTHLVQIDEVDGWDLMTHDVELEVADGRVLTAHGDGDCLVPPDADALLEQYGTPIVGAEKVAMLSAKLARLEQLADVRSVAAGLRG